MIIKSKKEWDESGKNLEDFIKKYDRICNEFYYYMLCVLPPLTNDSNLLQVGEGADMEDGEESYPTFFNDGKSWIYYGNKKKVKFDLREFEKC